MTKFPSALRRAQASSGPAEDIRKKGPSAKQLALMTADQLKAYYQRKGEWPEANWEEIQYARKGGRY